MRLAWCIRSRLSLLTLSMPYWASIPGSQPPADACSNDNQTVSQIPIQKLNVWMHARLHGRRLPVAALAPRLDKNESLYWSVTGM